MKKKLLFGLAAAALLTATATNSDVSAAQLLWLQQLS